MLSRNCWTQAMGAQQVKESTSTSALGAGTSIRASRMKSRVPKDSRLIGSNIFTEHSGELLILFSLFFAPYIVHTSEINILYNPLTTA